MPSIDFQKICRDMSNLSDVIEIQSISNQIRFSCKGDFAELELVRGESANGLSELSRNNDIPIINGIITTDNREQALKRSQIIGSNKGWDAMDAAFKVISIYRNIQNNS